MNSVIAIVLAGLMLAIGFVSRRYDNYYSPSLSCGAFLAMWFCLAWSVRLKWGQAGMEQWRSIRERGRTYFALIYGGFWLLFIPGLGASLNFAYGDPFEINRFWWKVGLGFLVGPFCHFWAWNRLEREFREWQKTGPLPLHGVV